MTESQDVLAEAIKGQGLCYHRHGTTPAGQGAAAAILSVLAARGYALVRTPETLDVADGEAFALDVERSVIPHSLVEQIIEGTIGLRAASPAPDPGAGLREALERIEQLTRPYPLAETGWPQRYPPIAATEEAHSVAVAALAQPDGES